MAVDLAKIPTKTRDFAVEVSDEIKKVTWPDWPQLKSATLVIIVFILIVSGIIWLMDLTVNTLINRVIIGLFR